jgi:diguanylate cyclase (GGDEF)-like protein
MAGITRIKTVQDETRFIEHKRLDIDLVEIFLGYKPGAAKERDELDELKDELGAGIYPEIVYVLLHKIIKDEKEARALVKAIVHHKKEMDKTLGRDTGIQVAALDYASNIEHFLAKPTVIEEQKIEELTRVAYPEQVTRAYDKNALLNDLKREVERTKRYGLIFSVVFIDVDNVKQLNETYGRPAGDFALKYLRDFLKSNVRTVDSVYRVGGDEFVVMLPNADLEVAKKVAEKLLVRIRRAKIIFDAEKGIEFSLTVSIALESFDDQTVQNVEGVLTTADTLLEEAKKAGKNRIELARYAGVELSESLERSVEAKEENARLLIKGTSISPGVTFGKAFVYEDILDEVQNYEIAEDKVDAELARLRDAIQYVKRDIEKMEKQVRLNLGKEYADIFMVHRTILSDNVLINEMEDRLRQERMNAEHIIRNAFKHFENRLVTSNNKIIRERSLDIADLSRRLLRYLAGLDRNIFSNLPRNRIVVAKHLLPSESVHLRRGNIRAIVTEKGSRNSHAAILARGLGIPYVSETEKPVDRIAQDAPLITRLRDGGAVLLGKTNLTEWANSPRTFSEFFSRACS